MQKFSYQLKSIIGSELFFGKMHAEKKGNTESFDQFEERDVVVEKDRSVDATLGETGEDAGDGGGLPSRT